MKIEILGSGCAKCAAVEKLVRETVDKFGVTANIHKVTKVAEIMQYDVMLTPAVVVDGEVQVSGKVPTEAEVKGYLGLSD